MRLDHAVVLVPKLAQATRDFAALGFTVTPGGVHAGGRTENALIAFADGSYLELLAFTRAGWQGGLPWLRRLRLLGLVAGRLPALDRRFLLRSAGGTGLIDLALQPDDLEGDLVRLRGSGMDVEGPVRGGRVRADDTEVAWELGIPRAEELPFLCADVTDRDLRVPTGAAREHENGARGIAAVVLAVEVLERAVSRYRTLLGAEPRSIGEGPFPGSRSANFALTGAEIVLLAPVQGNRAASARLLRGGAGLHSLRLRGPRGAARVFDATKTGGVHLEMVDG